MKMREYLLEEDNDKKSIFARAKAKVLGVAKSKGRSTKGIEKSQSTSDLEKSISGWKDAQDPKLKAAYNNVVNSLKSKSKESSDGVEKDKPEDSEEAKQEELEKQKKQAEKEKEKIDKEIGNLDVETAQAYVDALEKEKADIAHYDKVFKEYDEKKSQAIQSIGDFVANLLKMISDGFDTKGLENLSATDRAKQKYETLNSITDASKEVNEFKENLDKEHEEALKAQDDQLENELKKLNSNNSPEVRDYENQRERNIEREESSLAREFECVSEYKEYKRLKAREEFLSDDDAKKLQELSKNSKIKQVIASLNDEYPPLQQKEKDQMNKEYREVEEKRLRDEVEKNKAEIMAEYEHQSKLYEIGVKSSLEKLEKLKNKISSKDGISDDESDELKKNLKDIQNYCNSYMKERQISF